MIQQVTPPTLQIDLASIVRGIQIGDPIVFEFLGVPGSPTAKCGALVSSTELVWYANPAGYSPTDSTTIANANPSVAPGKPPGTPPPTAIAIPHTEIVITWTASVPTDSTTTRPTYLIRYGWKIVGNLIATPAPQVAASGNGQGSAGGTTGGSASTPVAFAWASGPPSFAVPDQPVLVQDVNGNGATGAVSNDGTTVQLTGTYPALVPPLQVLFNLLNVNCGKTVANEVLGSGNAARGGPGLHPPEFRRSPTCRTPSRSRATATAAPCRSGSTDWNGRRCTASTARPPPPRSS